MARPPTIYFYCGGEEENLQEDVIALAEGLRVLGVPFFSSRDYWRESPQADGYLLRHDRDVAAADCDVVVVSYTWPLYPRLDARGGYSVVRRPLPPDLFAPGRRYKTVYMDHHDGYRTVSWDAEFRAFDLGYFTFAMGSVQQLTADRMFVGLGLSGPTVPDAIEYDLETGKPTFVLTLPPNLPNYRAYKYP